MVDSATLALTCRQTAEHARGAIDWLETPASQATIGPERPVLTREFRRFTTTARKLEAAVERPMCVGVFGPSQAGKSYLVSVLAAPSDRPLISLFEGQAKDFIREINPVGEKEFDRPRDPLLDPRAAASCGLPGLPAPAVGRRHRQDHRQHLLPGRRSQGRAAADRGAHRGAFRSPGRRPGPCARASATRTSGTSRNTSSCSSRAYPTCGALASFWDEAAALAPRLDGEGRTAAVQPALGRPRAVFVPLPDACSRRSSGSITRPRPSARSKR